MAKTTLQILEEARALISAPSAWIKRDLARDRHGDVVAPDGQSAYCWCAVGALQKVDDAGVEQHEALDRLRDSLGLAHRDVAEFNDDPRTIHADVLALFDRAIASERAKAGA